MSTFGVTMKKILLASAALVLSVACTKKSPERAATDATSPAPSAIPDANTPTPSDVAPTNNEMPGNPDSTNSVPGQTTPAGEGQLPTDTTPAPGTTSPTPSTNP